MSCAKRPFRYVLVNKAGDAGQNACSDDAPDAAEIRGFGALVAHEVARKKHEQRDTDPKRGA